MRSERLGTEGAVEPDDDRPGVGDGRPERLDGLAAERPARGVDDGPREDQRQSGAGRLERGLDTEDRGLAIERVEDRLDEEDVGAALDQALGRLLVGRGELLERHVASRGVGDVRRDRGGPVRRPEGASNEAGPVRFRGLRGVGGFAGDPRRCCVHLANERLQRVIALGNAGRGERVRLDDVGAGFQIGVVDRSHDRRLRQREQVVVAAKVARVVAEPGVGAVRPARALRSVRAVRAAEPRLVELVGLDQRAHRPVDDEDPLGKQGSEERGAFLASSRAGGDRGRRAVGAGGTCGGVDHRSGSTLDRWDGRSRRRN